MPRMSQRDWQITVLRPKPQKKSPCSSARSIVRILASLNGNVVSHLRWSQGTRWRRERRSNTIHKQSGLVLIRHAFVHHWAVAVALCVCREALHGATPVHITDLLATHPPVTEALKMALCLDCGCMVDKAYKSVAKTSETLEIGGQVDETVICLEALQVKQLQKRCTSIVIGQISEHQSCPFVIRLHLLTSFVCPTQGRPSGRRAGPVSHTALLLALNGPTLRGCSTVATFAFRTASGSIRRSLGTPSSCLQILRICL